MRAKQSILGLVYTGSEVRRAPLVGMQFLHEGAVRAADFVPARPRLQAKDLIGLLVPSFCRSPPCGAAPLPYCAACSHARRETGGPDSFQVRRRFPRRSSGSSPPVAAGRIRRASARHEGPATKRPASWPQSWSSTISRYCERTCEVCPAERWVLNPENRLPKLPKPARRMAPSRAGQRRKYRAGSLPRVPPASQRRRQIASEITPPAILMARASTAGLAARNICSSR